MRRQRREVLAWSVDTMTRILQAAGHINEDERIGDWEMIGEILKGTVVKTRKEVPDGPRAEG